MPVKQCLEGSLEILNVYVRKEDGFQINNQSFHLKKLGEKKKEQIKPKASKRRETNNNKDKYELHGKQKNNR